MCAGGGGLGRGCAFCTLPSGETEVHQCAPSPAVSSQLGLCHPAHSRAEDGQPVAMQRPPGPSTPRGAHLGVWAGGTPRGQREAVRLRRSRDPCGVTHGGPRVHCAPWEAWSTPELSPVREVQGLPPHLKVRPRVLGDWGRGWVPEALRTSECLVT